MNLSPFPHFLSISSSFPHSLSICSQPGCKAATIRAALQRTYHEIAFYQSSFAQEKKVTIINFHYHRKTIFSVIFTKHLSERSGLLVEAKTSGQSLSIINPISHPSLGPQKQCSLFFQPDNITKLTKQNLSNQTYQTN